MKEKKTTGKRVSYEKVLEFKKLRDEGKTIREIAKKTRSSSTTILMFLKKLETLTGVSM